METNIKINYYWQIYSINNENVSEYKLDEIKRILDENVSEYTNDYIEFIRTQNIYQLLKENRNINQKKNVYNQSFITCIKRDGILELIAGLIQNI